MGKTKKSWKQRVWQWRGVWVTTPVITALVILVRTSGLLQGWEWAAYDQFLRLRPQEQPDDRIVIVGLTEEDYRRLGRLVFPDGIYAQLLEKLKAQNPRAIGLDIYRPRPVEPGHEDLVRVFESTPNLIGIQKVSGDSERETIDPPPALQAKGLVGANDTLLDADNKVRRGLLTVANARTPNQWVPSFAMNLAARYLDAEGIGIEIAEGTDNWWQLGDTILRDLDANEGGYIRTETGDYQILLNYRSTPVAFDQVSLIDVLDEKIPADWATDRIVLIGAVADSANDVFFTPYSAGLLELPKAMPGVEIHAHLTSQIISAVLDDRALMRSWPEYLEWGWIFLWSGIAASIAWTIRHLGANHAEVIKRMSAIVIAVGVLLGTSYGALILGWWIPVVPPLLGVTGATVAIVAYIARSAGDIRKTFGRYLTDEVVANLLENPEGLKMGGERRKITILTSDLRGFTAISERLPPEQVVKILNFYLGYMADVITRYQGTIDEFMGDGILVLFGAPTVREDDPRRAIACAVAMQQAMTEVNTQMRAWEMPELEMGIGINTGEVVVGNIGSEKRTKYGVVGSQVNLTYRIESYTTGGQILVPETTLKEAGDDIRIGGQKEVSPKGVTKPITIYEIEGIGGEYQLYLEREEEIFFSLIQPLLLQYRVLEGKHIGADATKGKLLRLSNKGGEIQFESNSSVEKPAPLQNIKLNFLNLEESNTNETNANGAGNESGISEDVYAKVMEKESATGNFYVKFTAKPPKINQKLQEIYQTLEG
ncbi:MAG: adenylate/guanylate cyclase domain-containing protein [Cyanobacteria bacterium SBLK]|nr:adenylate/guanylate cyclase domain-containing protein [Cyanobacteria bacterium SBLK]